MELEQILSNKATTSVIQLTVTDESNAKKQALFIFNPGDNWFVSDNSTVSDVLGYFSGSLMRSLERDKTARLLECDCFNVVEGVVKKSIKFCPMIRVRNVFKSCIVYENGSIEVI